MERSQEIEIRLSLTEKEAGYLIGAISEFYHKMRDSVDRDYYLTPSIDQRVSVVAALWRKVEQELDLKAEDGHFV